MNPNESHLSANRLDIAQSQPTVHPATQPPQTSKPYAPPAILHELALETRAGSAVSVDPVFDPITEILGIPTK